MRYEIHNTDNLEWLRQQPDNSIDSVVTDPPYGLGKEPDAVHVLRDWIDHGFHEVGGKGFMGKTWDAFVPQPIFWKEVYRVLKPGGHVLSFAGTRTYDWMVMAIRLAGFEIRDQLIWMYGGGFPKSMDISKQIDKRHGLGHATEFTAWMRSTGIKAKELNEMTDSFMGSHYLTNKEQAAIPTEEMFKPIRQWLADRAIEIPANIEHLVNQRTIESENMKRREVIKENESGRSTKHAGVEGSYGFKMEFDRTTAHTPEAAEWEGWGTALSPSHEPIVLARKPIERGLTVAANVLKWGTGALNIDGCRIGVDGGTAKGTFPNEESNGVYGNGLNGACEIVDIGKGRWPSNLIHDGSPDVEQLFPQTKEGDGKISGGDGVPKGLFGIAGNNTTRYPESGSASRYFYCAKPSQYERSLGKLSEAAHPTVKPVALMHHLVTLVTPPNGVCLDPFCGSGTTGIGAMLAGPNIRFIGLEFTPEYIPIIEGRMANWAKYRQFIEPKESDSPAQAKAKAVRAAITQGEQGKLF